MDTSNFSISNESSNPSASKKIYFHGPYFHQEWSFPDSIIYYIIRNPSTSKLYQKMIQSCKYFFSKNSIIVIDSIFMDENCTVYLNDEKMLINLTKFNKKLWVTSDFSNPDSTKNSTHISSIISKLYRLNAAEINLHQIQLSFNEFKFLFSNASQIYLYRVTVKNEDGSIFPLENYFRVIRQAEVFECYDDPIFSSFTRNTVKKILKSPPFISKFILHGIPETFDIETFNIFMKKKRSRKFCLNFCSGLSHEYKARLDKINGEYIGTKKPGFKPPCIYFVGSSDKNYSGTCRYCPRC